ncbi:MAG: rRNA maturation RNase YbeY [Acholeplasmatales bacterium]
MNMMKVNFYNKTKEDVKELKKLLKDIFKTVNENYEFNVIFVSNKKIKELNKTYRNIDKETDVLSFPDEDGNYIGDIFISLEKAKEQALEYKHSLSREVGFLTVHGYLHLLGYDHQTKLEEKEMRALEENILTKANLERI